MKFTLPADKNSTLVFDDKGKYNQYKLETENNWYTVSLVDNRGNVQELCMIEKADIKRLAKAS